MFYCFAHRLVHSAWWRTSTPSLRVQPAMVGLVDGSLATLAPIFAVAGGILHTLPSRALGNAAG
jgi:hypothetical protein